MQTMISVNDPSFDLSAIVEVDESSDMISHGSERLELKFDSTIDLRDMDDVIRMPASSTAIWYVIAMNFEYFEKKNNVYKHNCFLGKNQW